ncbi:hypothetical protein [Bradyrhizobium ivorense]|nr:hypothetical protein [Bradyrhizobium ivorense]
MIERLVSSVLKLAAAPLRRSVAQPPPATAKIESNRRLMELLRRRTR